MRVSTCTGRRSTGARRRAARRRAVSDSSNCRGPRSSRALGNATGMRSMAHTGHCPGLGRRICGCMEQVQTWAVSAGISSSGSVPRLLRPEPAISPATPAPTTSDIQLIVFLFIQNFMGSILHFGLGRASRPPVRRSISARRRAWSAMACSFASWNWSRSRWASIRSRKDPVPAANAC